MSTLGWQPLLDAIDAAIDPEVKHALEMVADRVVTDASTVITEGVIHHVLDGADLVGRVSAEVLAGHWYHVTYKSLIVWPLDPDSGLLTGEEVYLGEEHTVVREIAPHELPHLGSEFRVTGKL